MKRVVILGSEAYLAVTALDSGPMILTDEERGAGWRSHDGIAYSPQIQSAADCRVERFPGECASYNEWYLFDSPCDLGVLCHGNIFAYPLVSGRVWAFVNYDAGFALHNPKMTDLPNLFWGQLASIQPESFIADSDAFLTFVTRNDDTFTAVCDALKDGLAPG